MSATGRVRAEAFKAVREFLRTMPPWKRYLLRHLGHRWPFRYLPVSQAFCILYARWVQAYFNESLYSDSEPELYDVVVVKATGYLKPFKERP